MAHSKKEWLLLIHQIPPKPSYFRVRIWRRLQQVGAIAVKQSVYALPKSQQSLEDFGWILKEIAEGGGDASICEAHFVEGLTDEQVIALFQKARKGEYEKILQEGRSLKEQVSADSTEPAETMVKLKPPLSRLKSRFDEIAAIDFFSAPERSAAEIMLAELHSQLTGAPKSQVAVKRSGLENLKIELGSPVRTSLLTESPARGLSEDLWTVRQNSNLSAQKVTYPGRRNCASTCIRASTPMRGIDVSLRCWHDGSARNNGPCSNSYSGNCPCSRPQGREVSSTGNSGTRGASQRHRTGSPLGQGTARSGGWALRCPL